MSELFLKILNFSINASWLIIVVLVLRLLLKKAPKWIFCVLWGLVAVRLVCPFTLKSVLSLLPSSEVIPQNITMAQAPVINTGITVINNAVNPVISETFAPQAAVSVNPLQILTAIAAVIWAAGMAAMIMYALISYFRLRKKVRFSIPEDKNIKTCDEIEMPFILGVFRPVIYLPSAMEGKARELVIAHETAHLKRCDHLWKPLGFAILTVYWFNPLCWIAYILLCRDIEAACDEKVIRDRDKKFIADYSQTLLDLSISEKAVSACPLAFGETGVKSRVKGVLNYKKPAFWMVIIAVIICVAAGICFLTDPVADADYTDNPSNNAIMENDPDYSAQLSDYADMKLEKTRIYYYTENTIDGNNIIDFSISLEPDGTFSWYETPYSSFIGMGKYEINDGILTLINDEEMTGNSDENRFRIKDEKLYFIEDGSSNFPNVKLEDGAEFVYGINPLETGEIQLQDIIGIEAEIAEQFGGWGDPAVAEQLEQDLGSAGKRTCEDDMLLDNGWIVDTVTLTSDYIIMTCYYPEYFWPLENKGQTCCMITGLILTDGSRSDCFLGSNRWMNERENNRVIYKQYAVMPDNIEMNDIDSICIRVWDPDAQEFSAAEEAIHLTFDENIDRYFTSDKTVVYDNDKLTVSINRFNYYHSSHIYNMRLIIANNSDSSLTVSETAIILNGISIPNSFGCEIDAGQEMTYNLPLMEDEVRAAGVDDIQTCGIKIVVDLNTTPAEHLEIEYSAETEQLS